MLYVCATPIGNLKDLTYRAVEILNSADIILCEDTRKSIILFNHYAINYKKLISLHEYNELAMLDKVLDWLKQDLVIVQVSDAGTPSISDPGAKLCKHILQHGYLISPLPGACAYTTLLSVAGLSIPSLFYGFLPATPAKRQKILNDWLNITYAICIYEAPHRIIECVQDIISIMGHETLIIAGRELTKKFETIYRSTAKEFLDSLISNPAQQRGEFVLFISPKTQPKATNDNLSALQIKTLQILLPELPPKKAVAITHKLVGGDKTLLYNYAISKPTQG